MPKAVDLSIIIVNYNGAGFIKNCFDSIFNSKVNFTYDIWVVDNNSQDESIPLLKTYADQINLIENKVNTGFSYGNNQAIKACKGQSVFLLNNDCVLFENTLQTLWDFHQSHPKVGAITPKLLNEDLTLQAPGSIWGQWRFKSTSPKAVPFIAGAAVIMSQDIYWEMGGLDEHLFFYNDDIDMCKALKKLGYPIYYVPTAECIHIGGLSTKFRRVASLVEGYRGGIYLSLKHYGFIAHHLYRTVLMIDILINLVIRALLSSFSQHQRDFFKGYSQILVINLLNKVYLIRDKDGQPISTSQKDRPG